MSCAELFQINATIVANEFIDKYMPGANGDYVKVYLFLLRNRADGISIADAAESLHLTEGDVRRAVRYWEEIGLISQGPEPDQDSSGSLSTIMQKAAGQDGSASRQGAAADIRSRYRRTEGKAILNTLSSDDEFTQLLFIVQKYRSKILTESEQEVIAYLYDGLSLPAEVIDYLVAYCVEKGHNNMRYIEKTGLDWASAGIRDARAARKRTEEFEKAKSSSKQSRSRSGALRGITRGTDLDDIVKAQLLQNM